MAAYRDNFAADDNFYEDNYSNYVMQNQPQMVQVQEYNYQDPDVNHYMSLQPVNQSDLSKNVAPVADNNTGVTPRHCHYNSQQIDEVQDNCFREKTKKQTLWGVRVFRDWLIESGRDALFEQMSKEVLAEHLRHFYPCARQKNGDVYQKQTLVNIRSSINRFLTSPPFNKSWDLMKDPEFKAANQCFVGNLRKLKDLGLDTSKNTPPLEQEHIKQIYENYFDPHHDNDPTCLQLKVYFDLCYFMGRRGKEKLRELKKEHFEILHTPEGKEYVQLTINESTKKSQGDDNNAKLDRSIVLAQPGNIRCPVATFKLYLSKLTDLQDFFQQANPKFGPSNKRWYNRSPVGVNEIGKFLKYISINSGLNKIYTNHSIRGTTVNAMQSSKEFDCYDTINVTGHKSVNSLKSYLSRPTLKQKEKYSKHLFKYANENEDPQNDASDAEDFDPPPPPTKKQKKKKKTTPTATISKPPQVEDIPETPEVVQEKENENQNSQVVPYEGNSKEMNVVVPSSSNNFMSLQKHNPMALFMGANLNNCTININIPK